jgi:hypothetical protein
MSISKWNEVKLAAEATYSDGFARRVLELFILQLKRNGSTRVHLRCTLTSKTSNTHVPPSQSFISWKHLWKTGGQMLQSSTTRDNMGMVWISHAPEYEKICEVHFPTKMTYAQNRNSRAISGQIFSVLFQYFLSTS